MRSLLKHRIPFFAGGTVSAGLHGAGLAWMLYAAPAPEQLPAVAFSVTVDVVAASAQPVAQPAQPQPAPEAAREPAPAARGAGRKHAAAKAAEPGKAAKITRHVPLASARQAVVAPLKPARYDAAYLHNAAPSYPALSRRHNEEGRVALRVFVSETGEAAHVALMQSSGHERLDEAALSAVRQWRFVPARQGGQLLASWVDVPVVFRLSGP